MTRIMPTFWPQHLFKFNSNNGPFPGHSNLGSDGRYTCSSLLLMVWWVPYLNKGCRPDFNNGLGGYSNSSPVLTPWRLFESDSNNGPSPDHSNLVSDKYTSVQVSWWLPYLTKGPTPDFNSDFNNGPGGDSNSGLVLVPGVYLGPNRIMAPRRATPILCQMKYTSVQISNV